jgi:hypothetical protein
LSKLDQWVSIMMIEKRFSKNKFVTEEIQNDSCNKG